MDSEQLGGLIDRHAAALELYARQWCDAPEDVVQEAFVKLARSPSRRTTRRPGSSGSSATGAINAGIAGREAPARGRWPPPRPRAWFEASPCRAIGERSIPSRPRPRRRCRSQQREVIVAHLWGGLTFEQIAELAGLLDELGASPLPRGPVDLERTPGGLMSTRTHPARPRAERASRPRSARSRRPEPARPRPRDVPHGQAAVAVVLAGRRAWRRDRREPRR